MNDDLESQKQDFFKPGSAMRKCCQTVTTIPTMQYVQLYLYLMHAKLVPSIAAHRLKIPMFGDTGPRSMEPCSSMISGAYA